MTRREVVHALAPVAVLWLASLRPLHAQHVGLVSVAEAYAAAWNARDLPAVLALFAPDAVVRERWGAVPPEVWDTRDPQVVRAYLVSTDDRISYNPSGFGWITGHQEIAAWAAGRFARHHRLAAGPYRAAGDAVGWSYREFVDPYQLVPGVSPAEGEAEAVVRDGRIAVLSFVQSPASLHQQRREGAAAFARTMVTHGASPPGDGPSIQPRGSRGAAAEPAAAAWPLALGGLALLGALAVARRRRRRL